MAVCSGNVDLVNTLLSHSNITVDSKDHNEWTPLHHACAKGFVQIVIALCNKEAKFCTANKDGDYPLHLAAAHNHVAVFSSLKNHQHFTQIYLEGVHNAIFVNLKVRERDDSMRFNNQI